MSQLAYNVGLTEAELTLLLRLIECEDMTDEDEAELEGIGRKLRNKRKQLRQREKRRS